jgi:hypothetical protein
MSVNHARHEKINCGSAPETASARSVNLLVRLVLASDGLLSLILFGRIESGGGRSASAPTRVARSSSARMPMSGLTAARYFFWGCFPAQYVARPASPTRVHVLRLAIADGGCVVCLFLARFDIASSACCPNFTPHEQSNTREYREKTDGPRPEAT